MLAPSGEGLIFYQAYGNLYAMTGRKTHLLEDKQIPSVGVFDEVYFLFGRHLDELYVTWAHLEKKRTRLWTNTKTLEDLCSQSLETGVTSYTRCRHNSSSDDVTQFKMASARTDSNVDLEDSFYDGITTKTRRRHVMSTLAYVDSETITLADGAKSSRVPIPLPDDPYVAVRNAQLVDTQSEPEEAPSEVCVTAAKLKLVLFINFNEKYAK
ncbi:hypothetical protein Tco_1224665 [Tanacetum coccineum]